MDDIIAVIGFDAALLLCAAFGGCSLYIPNEKTISLGKRNNLIRADRLAGAQLNDLARKYKLTTRRIIAICKI
jgi:Mor family transcriptional regulator